MATPADLTVTTPDYTGPVDRAHLTLQPGTGRATATSPDDDIVRTGVLVVTSEHATYTPDGVVLRGPHGTFTEMGSNIFRLTDCHESLAGPVSGTAVGCRRCGTVTPQIFVVSPHRDGAFFLADLKALLAPCSDEDRTACAETIACTLAEQTATVRAQADQ